jgi:hypothetical protein
LICGVTYAVVQENSGAQNTGSQNPTQQNTGSSNTMGSNSMSTGMSHTGTITKIDQKNHSITIRENSMGMGSSSGMSGSNPEDTAGNPGSTTNPNTGTAGSTGSSGTMGSSNAHSSHAMKGDTHTFKFNTSTVFGTTETSKGAGSISDFKVGDTVSFSTDSSGMITSIEKQKR